MGYFIRHALTRTFWLGGYVCCGGADSGALYSVMSRSSINGWELSGTIVGDRE
jgi:hypothetical protein